MTPAPQGWRGLAVVRRASVAVGEDGAVWLCGANGAPRRVAAPGEIDRVVLVDDPRAVGVPRSRFDVAETSVDAYGLVVFLSGRRPVLALRLGEWLPSPHRHLDGTAARRVSRAEDVVQALGLLIEYDDGSGVDHGGAAVRRVVHPGLATLPVWYRALVAAVAVAAVLVTVAAVVAGVSSRAEVVGLGARGDALLGTVPAALPAGLAAAQVVAGFVLHGEARRLRRLPAAAGGHEVRPQPLCAVDRGFAEHARMLLAADAVVLVDGAGREARLPGPERGGVVSLSLAADTLVFRDRDQQVLAILDANAWVGTGKAERTLRARCESVGIRVQTEPATHQPDSFAGPSVLLPLVAPFARHVEARGLPSVILLLPALLGVGLMVASGGSGLVAMIVLVPVLLGAVRVLLAAIRAYRVNQPVLPRIATGARSA